MTEAEYYSRVLMPKLEASRKRDEENLRQRVAVMTLDRARAAVAAWHKSCELQDASHAADFHRGRALLYPHAWDLETRAALRFLEGAQ